LAIVRIPACCGKKDGNYLTVLPYSDPTHMPGMQMEFLYFFLGTACALIAILLIYLIFPYSSNTTIGSPALGQGEEPLLLANSDFKLVICTTEIILVPAAPRSEEFLNRPPDAAAPYYRAIIVERHNLLKFAEVCLTAGLTLGFREKAS
jgi:hypothetical protein